MKNLFITIEGQVGTGKTHMAFFLEKILLEAGFTVKMNLENEIEDYGSEAHIRSLFAEDFEKRHNALKENVKITLRQRQMRREEYEVEEETDKNN